MLFIVGYCHGLVLREYRPICYVTFLLFFFVFFCIFFVMLKICW